MDDPFRIAGPALISFSGGRTSAYMLWRILVAYDFKLPDDIFVVFANTGREREETLRFVHECEVRFGIRIWWVEFNGVRGRKVPAIERFDVVGYNSASRRGEPFRKLIQLKGYLPNAVTRFCTADLKIDTMKQFMLSKGFETWVNVVGLRVDEMKRVMKQVMRSASGKERWTSYCPLALAGVSEPVVWQHWLGRNLDPRNLRHPLPQGFDLGIRRYEGNCHGCMLKGFEVLAHSEREQPGILDEWAEDEIMLAAAKGKATETGARYVTEYTMREIQEHARRSPLLIPIEQLASQGECTSVCIADDGTEEISDDGVAWLLDYMVKTTRDPPVFTPAMALEPAIGDLFG